LRNAWERLHETAVGFGEQRLRVAQLDHVPRTKVAHIVRVTHSINHMIDGGEDLRLSPNRASREGQTQAHPVAPSGHRSA
jgi:hypothetical protein